MKEEHIARCVFAGAMIMGPFPWPAKADERAVRRCSLEQAACNEIALTVKESCERLTSNGRRRTGRKVESP